MYVYTYIYIHHFLPPNKKKQKQKPTIPPNFLVSLFAQFFSNQKKKIGEIDFKSPGFSQNQDADLHFGRIRCSTWVGWREVVSTNTPNWERTPEQPLTNKAIRPGFRIHGTSFFRDWLVVGGGAEKRGALKRKKSLETGEIYPLANYSKRSRLLEKTHHFFLNRRYIFSHGGFPIASYVSGFTGNFG